MPKKHAYDAVVIGSGPNGLSAAITLARRGLSVIVYEAKETVGGGMRSAALTLPGFIHDICSAVHPLGMGSPFFHDLPLHQFGLEWVQPRIPLAHPFDDGSAVILDRSIEITCNGLGIDGGAYKKLMEPFVNEWQALMNDLLGPFHFPERLFLVTRFALLAIQSCIGLSSRWFKEESARALFAGLSAHSVLPLNKPVTAAFGLVLGILGHAVGWPFAKRGSQKIADALASLLGVLGGEIVTNKEIEDLDELPASRVILCDVTPKQLLKIAKDRLPSQYKQRLENYRYGPGVFKIDWALNQQIPWKAKECMHAGTVHVGGCAEEIVRSERDVWENRCPQKPYLILAQPSLFDSTRAPEGKQTAWAYCHVPNGSPVDMTERIESQIERFAPGFKDCILARSTLSAMEMEKYNPNYIGGDINGGVQDLYQLFTRPVMRMIPYSTPVEGLYICSSSTPPGGGVHGMCGYYAASAALKKDF